MAKIQKLQERGTDITIYPQTSSEAVIFNDGRTAQQVADTLDNDKVDKVDGKGLSTNDYTDDDKKVVDAAAIAQQQFCISGKYIATSGNLGSDNQFVATPLLPLSRDYELRTNARGNASTVHYLAFYDAEGRFISGLFSNTSEVKVVPPEEYPANAAFFRLCNHTVYNSAPYYHNGTSSESREGAMSEVIASTISADNEQFLLLGHPNITTGVILNDRAYVRSGYITISRDYDIEYSLNGAGAAAQIGFYGAKKEYISGLHATIGDNVLLKDDIPQNAVFAIFSTATASKTKSYYRNGPSREARESAISVAIVASGQAFQSHVVSQWAHPGYYLYKGTGKPLKASRETTRTTAMLPLNHHAPIVLNSISALNSAVALCFYDCTGAFISYPERVLNATKADFEITPEEFPDNAVFFRVCDESGTGSYSNGATMWGQAAAAAEAIMSAKESLFIDQWNDACGAYGKYNTQTGFYELNGLTDITYSEAVHIMTASMPLFDSTGNKYNHNYPKVRTLIPNRLSGIAHDLSNWHTYDSVLQTVQIISGYGELAHVRNLSSLFYVCTALKHVYGTIQFDSNPTTIGAFKNCFALETIYLSHLNTNISLAESPLLSLESLSFMVENKVSSSQVAITVHPDVYAKLTDETNIEWNQVLNDAIEKNITFVTA